MSLYPEDTPKTNNPGDAIPKMEAKAAIFKLFEKQSLDIESLNQNIDQLKSEMQQIPQLVQNVVIATIQQLQQAQATPIDTSITSQSLQQVPIGKPGIGQMLSPEILQMGIEKILTKILGSDEQPANILGLDPNFFVERMKNKILADMDLEDTIVESVKNSLKSKSVQQLTKNVIKHSLE